MTSWHRFFASFCRVLQQIRFVVSAPFWFSRSFVFKEFCAHSIAGAQIELMQW